MCNDSPALQWPSHTMCMCSNSWKQENSLLVMCIGHQFHMHVCPISKLTLIAWQSVYVQLSICYNMIMWLSHDVSASLQLAGIIRPHDGNCYTPRLVGNEPDTRYTMWGVFVSRCFHAHHHYYTMQAVLFSCGLHVHGHTYITWFLLLSGTINFTVYAAMVDLV